MVNALQLTLLILANKKIKIKDDMMKRVGFDPIFLCLMSVLVRFLINDY